MKPDSEKNNTKPWGNSQGSLQVHWEKNLQWSEADFQIVILSCPLLSKKKIKTLNKIKVRLNVTTNTFYSFFTRDKIDNDLEIKNNKYQLQLLYVFINVSTVIFWWVVLTVVLKCFMSVFQERYHCYYIMPITNRPFVQMQRLKLVYAVL